MFDDKELLKKIVEAALLASDQPLTIERLRQLFSEQEQPAPDDIKAVLSEISGSCEARGFELIHVASGYRFQVRQELSAWVGRLWEEKPPRYSRALLETLALIAYRQPITRGDIEDVRGVAVSSSIIKTLLEHEWIKVVGHREVPGRPALYSTTKYFLDHFNLKNLNQLPTLSEIRDLDQVNNELPLDEQTNTSNELVNNVIGLVENDSKLEAESAEVEAELIVEDSAPVDDNHQQEHSLSNQEKTFADILDKHISSGDLVNEGENKEDSASDSLTTIENSLT